MRPHQHDLFTTRAPERRSLRDWVYLEVHARRRITLHELRWRMHAEGYSDELVRGQLEREVLALVDLYLVRRVRGALDVLEVCP